MSFTVCMIKLPYITDRMIKPPRARCTLWPPHSCEQCRSHQCGGCVLPCRWCRTLCVIRPFLDIEKVGGASGERTDGRTCNGNARFMRPSHASCNALVCTGPKMPPECSNSLDHHFQFWKCCFVTFSILHKIVQSLNQRVYNDIAVPQFYVHISLATIQSMVGCFSLDMFLNYVLAYYIKCTISMQ